MNFKKQSLLVLSLVLTACSPKPKQDSPKKAVINYQNKGHTLVASMVKNVGTYQLLSSKKDVVYTYTYQTPDGKTDISTEKYIFKDELSTGTYKKHQRTLPDLDGTIEQGYDGENYWLKHNNKIVNDSVSLKRVVFNRHTNYYWFTMFQKLLDSGLNYEYIGEKSINKTDYDIVKVSFDTTDNKPTDIYQLYINKKTNFVDQFLFTVVDFGVVETPFIMILDYEKIDGIWIPTQRKYKKSTWNATVSEKPWTHVNWTNIKFNNHLNIADFKE